MARSWPLDGKLVRTTTDLRYGIRSALLLKGARGIAIAATNMPEGSDIHYWLHPTPRSRWPALVIDHASTYGCAVNTSDIREILGETVKQAAERLWPGVTYDYALPQYWVDAQNWDPRGQVVWGYINGFGFPLPLTAEAACRIYQNA